MSTIHEVGGSSGFLESKQSAPNLPGQTKIQGITQTTSSQLQGSIPGDLFPSGGEVPTLSAERALSIVQQEKPPSVAPTKKGGMGEHVVEEFPQLSKMWEKEMKELKKLNWTKVGQFIQEFSPHIKTPLQLELFFRGKSSEPLAENTFLQALSNLREQIPEESRQERLRKGRPLLIGEANFPTGSVFTLKERSVAARMLLVAEIDESVSPILDKVTKPLFLRTKIDRLVWNGGVYNTELDLKNRASTAKQFLAISIFATVVTWGIALPLLIGAVIYAVDYKLSDHSWKKGIKKNEVIKNVFSRILASQNQNDLKGLLT